MSPITRAKTAELNKKLMLKNIQTNDYFCELDLDISFLRNFHNYNPPEHEASIINSFQERLNRMFTAAEKTWEELDAQVLIAQEFERDLRFYIKFSEKWYGNYCYKDYCGHSNKWCDSYEIRD